MKNLKIDLNNIKNKKLFIAALNIIKKLSKNNIKAYIVGGFCRDILLNRESNDIDLAILSNINTIKKIFKRIISVGARFNSYIIIENDLKFEIFLLPEKNIQKDALRRDLTINSLFYDYKKQEILDFTNGIKHIKNKLLKTPKNSEITIKDDPLRIMRILRFKYLLNFKIHKALKYTLKKYYYLLNDVPKERIRDEFIKGLNLDNSHLLFKSWERLRILDLFFKNIQKNEIYNNLKKIHKNDPLFLKLAIILYKMSEKDIVSYLNNLRFSGSIKEKTLFLIRNLDSIKNLNKISILKAKALIKHPYYKYLKRLYQLISTNNEYKTFLKNESIIVKKNIKIINLKGRHLIKLGISPGPLFKKIIDEIREKSANGEIKNFSEALKFAKKFKK